MTRGDGRAKDQLRDIKITRDFVPSAAASAFIEWGRTRVLVTASIEDRVPPFLVNSGHGWISAEYNMLPGSTPFRKARDGRRGGHVDGRTIEIQRLIGRSLRSVVNTKGMGQRTVWIDCDVIEADAGTRTASITGAWIVLYDCLHGMREKKLFKKDPLTDGLAAVSVAIVDGKAILDPCYEEDAAADADLNFVMSHKGGIVEIQGTGEKAPIPKERFEECYALAEKGIAEITSLQNRSLIRLG